MFIQTEQTPNPATLKFLPGCPVMGSGTANFPVRGAASRSPLAERLFQLHGRIDQLNREIQDHHGPPKQITIRVYARSRCRGQVEALLANSTSRRFVIAPR